MRVFSEIVIVKGLASGEVYWVGRSDPVKFLVWLLIDESRAVGFPVDWSIDGELKETVVSDEKGISSINLKFEPGEHTVTARISGAAQGFEFRVLANPQYAFKWFLSGPYYEPIAPDILMPFDYTLTVYTVDAEEGEVSGVPFRVEEFNTNTLTIKPDDDQQSVPGGVAFHMDVTYSNFIDTRFVLRSAHGVEEVLSFKIGRLFPFVEGRVEERKFYATYRLPFGSGDSQVDLSVARPVAYVASRDWTCEGRFPAGFVIYGGTAVFEFPEPLIAGDLVIVEFYRVNERAVLLPFTYEVPPDRDGGIEDD
ncbi:hypothetical protein K5D56_12090 [Pseudomonas cichorii]|uniref:Uncharacterized protein n=1 Tax=Pseudomonas lijiangensis TaxID=2995658 RepID=A0ABX8HWB0_9PSED|nr:MULTISPECIES: hypothetical protein [Pseudomonas syringae group]MBX8489256.1 hypothetical protein [Pseudomonas cichorii]MBX8500435.1 hypothetical protein [Pseudomonas lijiangensis]MBX8505106.1 hypothetical protein [Pseudomonas lijiangensis]MBX8537157.1 hypothetical protein [Pseudomonas cichorii]MBX8545132.1 hypothetical protein [Pseudomonas cichorii]